jgi:hypothetical protein
MRVVDALQAQLASLGVRLRATEVLAPHTALR